MELHETDYQLLNNLYENIDAWDISEQNEVVLLNNIPEEKKYSLAVLCVTNAEQGLPENEKTQLEKILVYLKESFDTVPVFVCSKNNPVKFAQIASVRNFSQLIVFGGTRAEQNVFVAAEKGGHQPIQIGDVTLYFTHSLATMLTDEARKKQFLAMLQQYFK